MRNKRLLHETLPRPLPRAAVDRPKQGFTLPFAQWMGGELQPFVRSGMAYLAESGWIAPEVPDDTWSAWQARRGALEPPVGARRARRIPEADVTGTVRRACGSRRDPAAARRAAGQWR